MPSIEQNRMETDLIVFPIPMKNALHVLVNVYPLHNFGQLGLRFPSRILLSLSDPLMTGMGFYMQVCPAVELSLGPHAASAH